jgi:uncharacterized SAM-binding protein YcdF (DUF218 family)
LRVAVVAHDTRGIRLSHLLTASGIVYLLAALGLLALTWPRARRLGCWLLGGAAGTLLLFSSGRVAAALMAPLEYAYPAVHSAQDFPGVDRIVVLTGYAADDPEMPLTGRLHYSSAQRVTMTLQLARSCVGCRVIVSGEKTTAHVMAEVLIALGLPAERLELEDVSRTTAESARELRARLLGRKFFLVTSAGHMTRAMAVVRKAGLDAIAVPTDHQLPRRWTTAELRPSPESLRASDLAIHEYLGRLWYRIRGTG